MTFELYTTITALLNGEIVESVMKVEDEPEIFDVTFESGHCLLLSAEELLDYITAPGVTNDENVQKIATGIGL